MFIGFAIDLLELIGIIRSTRRFHNPLKFCYSQYHITLGHSWYPDMQGSGKVIVVIADVLEWNKNGPLVAIDGDWCHMKDLQTYYHLN